MARVIETLSLSSSSKRHECLSLIGGKTRKLSTAKNRKHINRLHHRGPAGVCLKRTSMNLNETTHGTQTCGLPQTDEASGGHRSSSGGTKGTRLNQPPLPPFLWGPRCSRRGSTLTDPRPTGNCLLGLKPPRGQEEAGLGCKLAWGKSFLRAHFSMPWGLHAQRTHLATPSCACGVWVPTLTVTSEGGGCRPASPQAVPGAHELSVG